MISSCVFGFKTFEVYDFEVPYDPSYLNLDPNDKTLGKSMQIKFEISSPKWLESKR